VLRHRPSRLGNSLNILRKAENSVAAPVPTAPAMTSYSLVGFDCESRETVGPSSRAMNVTLKNNLLQPLAFSSITITGANPADFAQTNTCGNSVAANSGCVISVTFEPAATGSRTATLNLNDGANNSPQTVSLTGTGR